MKKLGIFTIENLAKKAYIEKVSEEEYNSWKTKRDTLISLKQQLIQVDDKSARAIRAIVAGTATEEDKAFLADLETQASSLRLRIKQLEDTLGE